MTYKQIEASREVRLWIGQVIVPGVIAGATLLHYNPEIKTKLHWKKLEVQTKIHDTFSKKEKS